MKILIVDDSKVMRNMIKRALEKANIEATVFEAGDGREGLAELICEPDLVLCDWNMPNMDGIAFLRALKEKDIEIPVIMVTTETHFSKRQQAMDAGARGFIGKPFTPEELAQAIREIVPA